MKFPPSSSFVVTAALIASSSTPTLAAPAGAASEGAMTASASNQFVASHDHKSSMVHTAVDKDEKVEKDDVEGSTKDDKGLLGQLLCDIGALLGAGCSDSKKDAKRSEAAREISSGSERDEAAAGIATSFIRNRDLFERPDASLIARNSNALNESPSNAVGGEPSDASPASSGATHPASPQGKAQDD